MHILDRVIALFESIPGANWITNMVDDGWGNRCAMGHLMGAGYTREQMLEVEAYLIQFDPPKLDDRPPVVCDPQTLMKINDNYDERFTCYGYGPKERVVNVLKLARKLLKRKSVVES